MKKFALSLFIVLFCFSLVACEPGWYSLGYDLENRGEVVSVELIDYKNDDQKRAPFFLTNVFIKPAAFKNDNYSVLETLGEDKQGEFLEQLQYARVTMDKLYESPKGYCLKINYSNGNFLIVGLDDQKAGYVGEYAADGSVVECCGSVRVVYNDPAMLANQYFAYQVPVTEDQIKYSEREPMERKKNKQEDTTEVS